MIYNFVEQREAEEPALAFLHRRHQTESCFRFERFIMDSEIAGGLPRIEQRLESVLEEWSSLIAALHASLLPPDLTLPR